MISNIFLIAAIPIVWLGIIRARFKWYLSTPLFIVVLLVMGAVIWWANAPNMSPSDADLMRSVQAAQKKIEETNKEIQRLRGVQEKMANILTREASSSQLQRLAKEYDCGFVLIAFSGEVGGTMAKAYASEIECNWRRCLIVEHQLSGMCIKVPELSIREGPSVLSYKDLYLGLPAEAGQQQRAVACGDIGVFVERLRTEPIGTCAVIGFKKIDANS